VRPAFHNLSDAPNPNVLELTRCVLCRHWYLARRCTKCGRKTAPTVIPTTSSSSAPSRSTPRASRTSTHNPCFPGLGVSGLTEHCVGDM
jgi:rRNA maturation protein Nop10